MKKTKMKLPETDSAKKYPKVVFQRSLYSTKIYVISFEDGMIGNCLAQISQAKYLKYAKSNIINPDKFGAYWDTLNKKLINATERKILIDKWVYVPSDFSK